jgi:multiple sugar transport system ATP-binding protein
MTLADRIVVMRDGDIEQIGTPIEVFNHPINTFVASFIGSPPMNLLPATVVSGKAKLVDGSFLPIPSRLTNSVSEGQDIVLGMRPDDLSPVGYGLDETGESVKIDLTIDLTEPLGMESLIYTRIADQEVQGKIYGPRFAKPGEVMQFRISLDRVHIFDAVSTKRLETA